MATKTLERPNLGKDPRVAIEAEIARIAKERGEPVSYVSELYSYYTMIGERARKAAEWRKTLAIQRIAIRDEEYAGMRDKWDVLNGLLTCTVKPKDDIELVIINMFDVGRRFAVRISDKTLYVHHNMYPIIKIYSDIYGIKTVVDNLLDVDQLQVR